MKKLLFLTAIISLLFVGCNNDNENDDPNDPSTETVRLLPSRMVKMLGQERVTEIHLEYDNFNRLVRIAEVGEGAFEVAYNQDHTPATIKLGGATMATFQYYGNLVLVRSRIEDYHYWNIDTLTINTNGQLIRRRSSTFIDWSELTPFRGYQFECNFFYNAWGNVGRIEHSFVGFSSGSTNFGYSDIKSIFRHVNIPDWFLFYLNFYILNSARFSERSIINNSFYLDGFFNRTGYMISSINGDYVRFSYELDSDGYVIRMNREWRDNNRRNNDNWRIEYIPAK